MALELNGTTGVSLVQDGVVTAADLASGAITSSALPAGSVLQVKTAFKNNAFSTASATFVDITDLSLSITPTSTSSKILVFCNIPVVGTDLSSGANFALVRNSTLIGQSTAGTTQNAIAVVYSNLTNSYTGTSFHYLDSPSTTSATTYKVQMLSSGSTTLYINRRVADTYSGASSNLTVMEIAG